MKGGKDPTCSTTDHWIQESVIRIFNSGLFCAVGAAEKQKMQTAISMLIFRAVVLMFSGAKTKFSFSKTHCKPIPCYDYRDLPV